MRANFTLKAKYVHTITPFIVLGMGPLCQIKFVVRTVALCHQEAIYAKYCGLTHITMSLVQIDGRMGGAMH